MNSLSLLLARHARNLLNTIQGKEKAISSYWEQVGSENNNLQSLKIDMPKGIGLGTLLTGTSPKYHEDLKISTKNGIIKDLKNYGEGRALLIKRDLEAKHIEASSHVNSMQGDHKRVNALFITEARESQRNGQQEGYISKRAYCFMCNYKTHWADECTANLNFDAATATRYSTFRKANINKKVTKKEKAVGDRSLPSVG